MTVQLESPFVWPEEPEDMSAWNVEEVKSRDEEREAAQEREGRTKDTLVNKERREKMREQAKALLEGKQKWKPVTRRSLGQMLTR